MTAKQVALTDVLHKRLHVYAIQNNTNAKALVNKVMTDYLDKEAKKESR